MFFVGLFVYICNLFCSQSNFIYHNMKSFLQIIVVEAPSNKIFSFHENKKKTTLSLISWSLKWVKECVLHKLSISKNEVHFKVWINNNYTSKTFTLLLKKFFLFQTSRRSTPFWCFKSKCIFWRLKPNHSALESQKTLDGVSISNCQTSCWRELHFVFEILIFVKCQLYKYFSNFQIKTNGTFL